MLMQLRLGEFTGFEWVRHGWVTQPELRQHPSSRGANSPWSAVFCSRFLSKSWAQAYPIPRSLGHPHKTRLHFNQFRYPFFLVIQLVLALQFFRALILSKGFDHVVPDVSNVPVGAPSPDPRRPDARGTGKALREV